MDEELTEGVEPEGEEEIEAAAPDVPEGLPSEVRKHMERQSRRIEKLQRRLAESELKAQHGDTIAAVVAASGLPTEKWGDYAQQVKSLIPDGTPTAQTEPATEEETAEAPSPTELALAAVTKGSADNTPGAVSEMSSKEILELGKRDPQAALRQIRAQYRAS